MEWDTWQIAIASLAGTMFAVAALVACQRLGERIRIRRYCRGFNNALCEAVGHYRATVELIVKHDISGYTAQGYISDRPDPDLPNVGEFNPLITVSQGERSLEDIDVDIEGPKKLIGYIHKKYAQATPMSIGGNAMRHVEGNVWEVCLTVKVFNTLDAEVIENLRSLLAKR